MLNKENDNTIMDNSSFGQTVPLLKEVNAFLQYEQIHCKTFASVFSEITKHPTATCRFPNF